RAANEARVFEDRDTELIPSRVAPTHDAAVPCGIGVERELVLHVLVCWIGNTVGVQVLGVRDQSAGTVLGVVSPVYPFESLVEVGIFVRVVVPTRIGIIRRIVTRL